MAKFNTIIRLSCVLVVCLLLLGSFSSMGGADSRTGTNGNEPTTGFSEGSEIIEIYHNNGDHDTAFDLGETLNIRITTDLVTDVPNQDNNNRVTFWDNKGNKIGGDHKPFFTRTVAAAPYEFEGSVDLSSMNGFSGDSDYMMVVVLREGGLSKFVFTDVVHVNGPGVAEEMSFQLYSDAAYTTETYDFPPLTPMYIEVWTGENATDPASSWVYISNYQELVVSKQLSQLTNATLTDNGNYTRFMYDLSSDFGQGFPLDDGYWYTLSVRMNDGTNDQVKDWAVQFMVDNSLANPPVVTQGDTTVDPASVIIGVGSTTISTEFTHADAPSPDAFIITYKVKDETGLEYVLVDKKSNGDGGLVVTRDLVDQTKFTSTFIWSPAGGQPVGMYDLNFKVDDGVSTAEDAYVNNEDELELRPQPNLPVIAPGATQVTPTVVKAPGPDKTVIMVNFSHGDAPTADSFKITFKVRDPGNSPPIVLVNQAQSGTSGLLVVKTGNNTYEANFTWDPPDTSVLGTYDLFTRVEDGNGAWAEDGFDENLEELRLEKDAALPTVISGATTADPSTINRTGKEVTIISTQFQHLELPGISVFEISFMVRDESGNNYTLVDAKKHGIGGLTITDLGNGDYEASYSWDPTETQTTGTYDLFFKAKDALDHTATDTFDANQEELTIARKPTAPVMTAGVTKADPSSVNTLGNETTILTTTFFHADIPVVSDFKISFKIRDVGNQEYEILTEGTSGTPNLQMISDGSGSFTANYSWDPPSVGQPLGTYDLFAKVVDSSGFSIQDGFNNNLEELTLFKKIVSPGNSTLSGAVKDIDGKAIPGATVKIYDSTSGAVVDTLTTDANGAFSTQLPAGLYDVGVEATDYKGEVLANQQLNEGQPLTLPDFKLLKTGGGGETPPPVETEVIPPYMLGLLALLIIIIVLMCLFMLMKHRTGDTEPGTKEKKAGHHAHEVDKDDVRPDHPIEPREKDEIDHEPKAIAPEKVRIEKIRDEDEEPGDPE